MSPNDIAALRLFNQQISAPEYADAHTLLKHMGAMQAQDFRSAIWAIGLRLKGVNISAFEKAYDSGKILRTHVMRPTWHMVARENINWILDLTAPQVLSQTKGRYQDLELTTHMLNKSHTVLTKALEDSNHLTREEILAVLKNHKLPVAAQQLSHILMNAELHKVICSGRLKNKKISYALFDERVPKRAELHHEEALAKLARIYFTSHGPALIEDFQWWSGLSLGKVRLGIAAIEKELSVEIIGNKKFYFFENVRFKRAEMNAHYLLPAFDEFIISYKDRSGMFTSNTYTKAVSTNGIFRPVVATAKGQIIGIWNQTTKPGERSLELQFFENVSLGISQAIEKELIRYSNFSGIKVTVKY
jgi:hypothetical protein